jgi:hypothetical protein
MTDSVEKKLSEMSTARLVKIILAALEEMNETEQISFIAKHIDARTSLSRLGADDPEAFINEVERFCIDCLNENYYSDEDDIEEYFSNNDYDDYYYDDEWDYNEYFSNTEWAETFSRLFKLSIMYIRSGDITTGYEASSRLLSCLAEMNSDDCFLGTDEPMSYIIVDWDELFALHYEAMFQYHADGGQAIELAFRCWMDFKDGFKDDCTEAFLSNVKEIVPAELFILEGLKGVPDWTSQRQCFELLEQLYIRLDAAYDKISQAKALISHNVYFNLFLVEGLCEQKQWQAAVETANNALAQIPMPESDKSVWSSKSTQEEIRAAIQTKLVNAYENLADFPQAFETAKCMFREKPDYVRYKCARGLAEKVAGAPAFLALAEEQLKLHSSSYILESLLRDIYSYEGEIEKMLAMASEKEINRNYYERKYIALSLIYRAVNGKADIGENLSEYLTSAHRQDGIGDMLISGGNTEPELLLYGVDLLRGIIVFHISAANRNRYAKAAYYMCVVRDIFVYLQREDEFRSYFKAVIMQNSRRPALRDEMSVVYGKEATMIKR